MVGDTTNGATSTMMGRELANGWFYSIATQKVRMFDGLSYEGIGLAPDFRIINSLTDLNNGKDAVLDKAIELLD
jgi:carboxyl-terminal processing protease